MHFDDEFGPPRRINPSDPIAELVRRNKRNKARKAMRRAASERKVASQIAGIRRRKALRALNPTEQGHANWASYNEGMSDAELAKFEASGSPEALLLAFKYAYGAQINYLDATQGADAARMGERVDDLEQQLMSMMGYERVE